VPSAPLPFWRWGWRQASWTQRWYFGYRVLLRPLLWLSALIGAVLVVVDAYPRARDQVFWRDVDYAKLRSIHAGYDVAFVKDTLGTATQTQALGETGFTKRIYVLRDAYAQVVSDQADRVVLYSVSSCDPEFQPAFDTGGPEEVQLQTQRLADTPLVEASGSVDDAMETGSRVLDYMPANTGSTPEHYLEWSGPSSTASGLRSYFVGVNPLCVEEAVRTGSDNEYYRGPLDEAPPGLLGVRERYAANTFAETTYPLTPALDDLGSLLLPPRGAFDGDCTDQPTLEVACASTTVGVFFLELPPSLTGDGETRTFGGG
jgi:hypothetical protein